MIRQSLKFRKTITVVGCLAICEYAVLCLQLAYYFIAINVKRLFHALYFY